MLSLAETCTNAHDHKKAELLQRWPRDAPYVWVPWKFLAVPNYAHGYFFRNWAYKCACKIWSS